MIGTPDITLPVNPSQASVDQEDHPVRFASPWTGSEQRLRRFRKWKLDYTWDSLTSADFDALMALFEFYSLSTPFSIANCERLLPTGSATAEEMTAVADGGVGGFDSTNGLLVNGSGQSGQSLNVKNAPAETIIFAAGDFIGLHLTGQVFRVRAECASDSNGHATIQLTDYIGASPADGEDVVVSYVPITVFIDERPEEVCTPPLLYSLTVKMTQAL